MAFLPLEGHIPALMPEERALADNFLTLEDGRSSDSHEDHIRKVTHLKQRVRMFTEDIAGSTSFRFTEDVPNATAYAGRLWPYMHNVPLPILTGMFDDMVTPEYRADRADEFATRAFHDEVADKLHDMHVKSKARRSHEDQQQRPTDSPLAGPSQQQVSGPPTQADPPSTASTPLSSAPPSS